MKKLSEEQKRAALRDNLLSFEISRFVKFPAFKTWHEMRDKHKRKPYPNAPEMHYPT